MRDIAHSHVMKTISSQRYIDPKIVAIKRAAADYIVQYVIVHVGEETYAVVVDGHHSIAAARADCVDLEYEEAHPEVFAEAASNGLAFLEAHHLGDDYYYVSTGELVW